MKQFKCLGAVIGVLSSLILQRANSQTIYAIGQAPTGAVQGVQIQWASNPLDQYDVLSASNLVLGLWTTSTLQSVIASNLTAGVSLTNSSAASFFMVRKKDMDPPAITPISPSSNAVAVSRSSRIQVQIMDVTGVNTNSVVFTLNGTNYSLASPSLSFGTNILMFTTASNGLGNYGQTATVSVASSDTLGNAATNTWSFQLEVAPVVQTNVIVIGAGVTTNGLAASPRQSSMPALQSASTLQLIGTYSNRLVFAYTGSPALNVGQLLASSDPTNIYYRQITSLSNDVVNSTITAFTADARLEVFLQAGSLNNAIFTQSGTNLQSMQPVALVQWNALTLHQSGTIPSFDLGTPNIGFNGPLGTWDVQAGVNIAADIQLSGLKSCSIDMNGAVDVDLSPEVIMTLAGSASTEVPLIAPITHFYGGFAGPVPVWFEIVFEINAGAEISAAAQGSITEGVRIQRDLSYSVSMTSNVWTNAMTDTGIVLTPEPLVYTLNGNVNAKVYLDPKITVYMYSLVGAYAALRPYAAFDGSYQNSPLQYNLALSAGLEFDVGMAAQFWNPAWGELPSWTIPALNGVIWSTSYPPNVPVISSPPSNVTCYAGQTASFTVVATGNPAPTYRWYQNGTLIPWATSPTLSFTASAQTTGSYQVVVANCYGSTNAAAQLIVTASSPSGMAYIPAGAFVMGATTNMGHESYSDETPQHTLYVSAFYMDRYEVTKALWDDVAGWADTHGYDISTASGSGKAANHPVYFVSWYECVKWCNARSEQVGLTPCYTVGGSTYRTDNSTPDCNWSANGYRLPTETEWEKAARGGSANHRFPWIDVDTIEHARANYWSSSSFAYDTSPTRGYHPTYTNGATPYTSPVGAFAANGYGLYDMAGNVLEWCWDWYYSEYYPYPSTDPRGIPSGSSRVLRGGQWGLNTYSAARVAFRNKNVPAVEYSNYGFRCVRVP